MEMLPTASHRSATICSQRFAVVRGVENCIIFHMLKLWKNLLFYFNFFFIFSYGYLFSESHLKTSQISLFIIFGISMDGISVKEPYQCKQYFSLYLINIMFCFALLFQQIYKSRN